MGSSLVFATTGQPRQSMDIDTKQSHTDAEPPCRAPSLAYMLRGVEADVASRKETAANLDKLAESSKVVAELRKQVRYESAARGRAMALPLPHGVYLVEDGFVGRSDRRPRGAASHAAHAGPLLYLEPLEAHHLRNESDMQTVVDDLVTKLKQLETQPNLVGAALTRCDGQLKSDTVLNRGAEALSHGACSAAGSVGACMTGTAHHAKIGVLNTLLLAGSDSCGSEGVLCRNPQAEPWCWPVGLSVLACPITAVVVGCCFCTDVGMLYFQPPAGGWFR